MQMQQFNICHIIVMQITKHSRPGTMLVAGQQTMTEKYHNKKDKILRFVTSGLHI